jgi:hypothetical protein
MAMQMGESGGREFAETAHEFMLPIAFPRASRMEQFAELPGANPVRIGFEFEPVWIGIGIEAGHGGFLL